MTEIGKDIAKIYAVTEEVEASYKFIEAGLLNLRAQKFAVLNNHVTLQLLAAGFERLLKILLLLKEKYQKGEFPELELAKKQFNKYNNGHGIGKMLVELSDYSNNVDEMQKIPMLMQNMEFLKTDIKFQQFVKIITEFAISQRYYYIDAIVLDKENTTMNPFTEFKSWICGFLSETDTTQLSHEQEDELAIKNAIICIEKGVIGITRFFTHGLGSLGRQYYGNFSTFILLKEPDLGSLKYSEKGIKPSDLYQPVRKFSTTYFKLALSSKSKTLNGSDYGDWPFSIDTITVIYKQERFYFAEIAGEVFALTGLTSTTFKMPTYFKSDKLRPKGYALFLLEEAKKLNPNES